ncbi:MAG: antitoxin [Chloroflexi bacterium]|nr:antitoxin [Chloroflexota bacterium]
MITRYQTLATRIRVELDELERTQTAIGRHWESAMKTPADQDAYFNSVAFNLHSLYTGLERIFELIALELDGGALGGESWHAELLRQMTLDLPDARPAVLERDTANRLDEYRKFRHRVRNIYATQIDPSRMESLVKKLPEIWQLVRQELEAFSAFLEQIARADEELPDKEV